IVITTRGTTGNIAYYDDTVLFDNVRINSGMAIIRNADPTIYTPYLYHVLRSPFAQRQIERLAFGSAQPQLTLNLLGQIIVPMPIKVKQCKIAEILRTWDEAIERLSALHAAKVKRFTWFRTDVFTGKKRLPGFAGEWREVQLRKVLTEH